MTFLEVICYRVPVKILLSMRPFTESCTMKEVSTNIGGLPNNTGKKLQQLKGLGLVEITHNGLRGRASNLVVKLTEKGRIVADKLFAINALTESGVVS